MRFLVTTSTNEPFFTEWFDYPNHFNEGIGMIVYDLYTRQYTKDGIGWIDIEEDNL
jgi:hypothetical protein